MTARKRPVNGPARRPRPEGEPDTVGGGPAGRSAGDGGPPAGASGPQSAAPWGTVGGTDSETPWGLAEDSPADEGSEVTAVTEGRRGERRAGASGGPRTDGLPTMEPTPVPEAGPGAPPDPGPGRRTFPEPSPSDDLPDNAIERQTGMHPEGVSRRSRR